MDGPSDYDLGASVVDAAEKAGVKHVVYSSGPSITNATKGRVHIEGFESKPFLIFYGFSQFLIIVTSIEAKYYVEQYGRKKGFTSFTPILCASFMECFFYDPFVDAFGGFPWIPDAETGEVVFRTPPYGGKGDMPWLSCEDDLGDIVHGIFLDPNTYDQVLVQATSQQITMSELAASYTQGTPFHSLLVPIPQTRS